MNRSLNAFLYVTAVLLFIAANTSPAAEKTESDKVAVRKNASLDDVTSRFVSDPPAIKSSWDDLLSGVKNRKDWQRHREVLRKRYLDLLRDQYKPARPPLELKWHEATVVNGKYTRHLISYNVEADERAHAFLGIPLELKDAKHSAPAVVALHGTYKHGKERAAGLEDNPDKAYLDHLCRRGYVV
ncbi:MAG: hypothetical protein JXM70_03460, partial [Pirellulales bacterium]|nr:hypothetical protein [Pirellulales bacterium]